MQKEAIIAIIIGSSIGLLAAFGVWRVNKNLKSPTATTQQTDKNAPGNGQKLEGLSIVSPNNNSVSSVTPVTISGIATPSTYVVAASDEDSSISLVAASGEFSQEIELVGGINSISIWGFDSTGNSTQEKLTLVYSSQLDQEEEQDASAAAQEKVDTASLGAITGTVTDITDAGLQIRSEGGEIVQIAVDTNSTTFANIIKTPKDIEYTDIAIGDFIVAIGQTTGQSTEARRVLVTTESVESNTKVLFGEVKTLSSKDFIVVADGNEYSIDATGKVNVTTTKDGQIVTTKLTTTADTGSKLIVVGKMEDEELVASKIYILPQISS